jgi:hypothetical protein
MFQYSNYNIVLFFYYVKNELEILLVFINKHDLYYILLYINIDFFIYCYIFYLLSKNTLIKFTH